MPEKEFIIDDYLTVKQAQILKKIRKLGNWKNIPLVDEIESDTFGVKIQD